MAEIIVTDRKDFSFFSTLTPYERFFSLVVEGIEGEYSYLHNQTPIEGASMILAFGSFSTGKDYEDNATYDRSFSISWTPPASVNSPAGFSAHIRAFDSSYRNHDPLIRPRVMIQKVLSLWIQQGMEGDFISSWHSPINNSRSDNYNDFMRAIHEGRTPEEAAKLSWTYRTIGNLFPNVYDIELMYNDGNAISLPLGSSEGISFDNIDTITPRFRR